MRIFSTILFLCFFGSCSTKPNNGKEAVLKDTIKALARSAITEGTVVMDDEETGIPAPRYVTDPKKKQILTYNDTLFNGDTLKLTFKVPHAKDLAIITPDDQFFFIVYAQSEEQKPSLIGWNEFASMEYLEIITNKTKANLWDARVKENQIIFTKTGKYEIRLSDNLETDDGTPVELNTIYYIHNPRE